MEGREAAKPQGEARAGRLQALAEVNLALSRQLDLEPLLHQITAALARLTGARNVVLWEAHGTDEHLARRAWTADLSLGPVELPLRLRFSEGAAGWIATHRQALFLDDITGDARMIAVDWFVRHDLLAFAGVPVETGAELLGVLTLNLARGHVLDADDRALILSLAAQAAAAIQNARLFADARTGRQAAEALAGVGRALAHALDPDVIGPRIADSIRALLDARAAALYRLDPETGDLRALAASGELGPATEGPASLPRGHGLAAIAVRERRPVATPNLLTDDRVIMNEEARRRLRQLSYRAVLVVPLMMKDEVIGALGVGDVEGRRFTDAEIRLAQTFADQAAVALENARLFAEATSRRREAEELARVARMFTESLDVTEVARRVVDSMLPVFRAVSSMLCLAEPDGSLRSLAFGGRAREHFTPGSVMPRGAGLLGRVIATGGPVRSRDLFTEPGLVLPDDVRQTNLALGTRAVLAVPLRSKGQVIGVISLADEHERDFSAAEVSLLEAFADQAAVALENATLFATAERRRREAEELGRVGRALAQTLNPDAVAQQIVDSVQSLLETRTAVLFRLDAPSSELVAWVFSGALRDGMGAGYAFPHGTGLAGLAVRERCPVTSAALLDDPRLSHDAQTRERLEGSGILAGLALPLIVHDRLIGVLSLGDSRGRVFSDSDVRLAQAFADGAALVLENARLYVETTRRRREAEELAQVARIMTESLDLVTVGKRVVESVLPLFHASFARIRLIQPDGLLRALAGAGVTADYPEADIALRVGAGVAGQAVAEGRTVRYQDALTDPAMPLTKELRRVINRSGARSIVGVPLRVRGEIIGALTVGDALGRAFTDDEVRLLETFADQAALAVDNARLYEQTRQRLRQVDSLREVVDQILGSFSLDDRLTLIARKATELLEGDRASVALAGDRPGMLTVRAGYGLFEGEVGRQIVLGQGGLGMAVKERQGLVVQDYPNWPERDRFIMDHEQARPLQAVVACPLMIRGQVMGSLAVATFSPSRKFTAADLERLESFAAPAALAIEHSRLYDELGTRLRELQDTQAQLVQAAKLSAVGQLVSGVAHELNNPLSVVIGHAQLLLAKNPPPEVRRPVELMLSQGDRMARIVQGLLLFSRQRQPSRGPVDVATIVGQILELRAAQLRLSGIRTEVENHVGDVRASGDSHQIQQVFLNLLLNAEQAILDGHVGDCIRVETRARRGADREWVVVEVSDNGPGIAPEVLPSIFDPFFTTKPVGQGTGLGLSVSYGIVEQHGGRLTAESRAGRTVFRVELPAMSAVASPETPRAAPRAVGVGRRALVVEDEPAIVDLVSTLLRQTGWDVDVSGGGRAALVRVRAMPYDLIVSDMRMAGGGGEEFYRAAIRERGDLARRFLFVTGDTANPAAWKFLEDTKAPVLEKPFTAEQLLRTIESLVG
jgi:GAF domain-containing protein/CheY-like chemotaxis protein